MLLSCPPADSDWAVVAKCWYWRTSGTSSTAAHQSGVPNWKWDAKQHKSQWGKLLILPSCLPDALNSFYRSFQTAQSNFLMASLGLRSQFIQTTMLIWVKPTTIRAHCHLSFWYLIHGSDLHSDARSNRPRTPLQAPSHIDQTLSSHSHQSTIFRQDCQD